jgi:uncharacterized protein involved in exopolysaccharide biosynthesis/Mrp family chromosome partitioning ATPase
MSDKRTANQQAPSGMTVGDVYYTLFRQKWKLLLMTLLGIGGAFAIYYGRPPSYESNAQLLLKYIQGGGEGIINGNQIIDAGLIGKLKNEAAILKSRDLAMEVATNIGPEKILAEYGGGSDRNRAAMLIQESITVDRYLEQSTILSVSISLLDQQLVQTVLKELVDDYKNKHNKIHNTAPQLYESYLRESADMKANLDTVDEDLRAAKKEINVFDFEEKKRYYVGQLNSITADISRTKVALSAQIVTLNRLYKAAGMTNIMAIGSAINTNSAAATNSSTAAAAIAAVAASTSNQTAVVTKTDAVTEAATNKTAAPGIVPQPVIDEYTRKCEFLAKLYKEYEDKKLASFKTNNPQMVELMGRITENESLKKQMEEANPNLVKVAPDGKTEGKNGGQNAMLATAIFENEMHVAQLQDELKSYFRERDEASAASAVLESKDAKITELLRKQLKLQRDYDNIQAKIEELRYDQQNSELRNNNIVTIQEPTQPSREKSKTPRLIAGSVVAGVLLGLVWAFITELLIDHSVRRAREIETDMGLKLFLTIPRVARSTNRRRRTRRGRKREVEPAPDTGSLLPVVNGHPFDSAGAMEIAPWDNRHSLHEYFEALRDRLITYFEVNNLTHKPKMVAVTGASDGCGATTLAVGLAASLSETGDGNVLLVDMNMEHGAAQHFYKGELSANLDVALSGETKQNAMVLDHLYVVGGNKEDKLFSMLPKRFANLMPKLQASDYDYIIFDMPAVARTGLTQRLAGFMDMMLLVVESEKTQRHVLRQSTSVLNESKAKVSVILNKTQTYVPPQLHKEF